MGRSTYQGMAQYFPTGTDAIADAMNRGVKTVFSHTLQTADWPTTTIVSGDTAEEIGKLKREGTGEILAHGGIRFARSLAQLDLVDEYRLIVHPHLAGHGQRLFTDATEGRPLELVSSLPFADGVVAMTYRRLR
jgi:dihydrofolate reductase